MKILVFGSTGLLGTYLTIFFKKKKKKVVETIGRSKKCNYRIPFDDIDEISKSIKKSNPDVIINLIAMTDVDECESNHQESYKANVKIPQMIIKAIKSIKNYRPHIVHISTDQVYSGIGPHIENKTNPINIYSKTKLDGEKEFIGTRCSILRTNFFGKTSIKNKLSFTDWLHEKLIKKERITVFDDVFFNPLSMYSLCDVINHVIDNEILGTYNVGSGGSISKAKFAFEFAEAIGASSACAKVGNIADVKLNARRPNDMTMDCKKIENKIGKKLPDIIFEIHNVSKDYL